MNNYIITYEGTDKRYIGKRWQIIADTEIEAIMIFFDNEKSLPHLFFGDNDSIITMYSRVLQSGDDWIQFDNGRFTAKLADEQPKENPNEGLQQEVESQEIERLKADKEGFERLSEKAKQAYSDLQGKRLDESIAYNKEYQRLQDEIDRLKAENDRLKAHIEIQQERATEAAFRSLEVIQDLHNKLTQSVPK